MRATIATMVEGAALRLRTLGLAGIFLVLVTAANAQDTFAGAMGGVSTLSADATFAGSPPQSSSGYKPENGPTLLLYTGRHFTDYFSAQASYAWNRHTVELSGGDFVSGASFTQPMRATLQTYSLEAMAYFRDRSSKLRPYLTAGPTILRLNANTTGPTSVMGTPTLPPTRIRKTEFGIRVAVGIDWKIGEHLSLRYSFSETIQRNPLGQALNPLGQRRLANFQNLWGFHFSF